MTASAVERGVVAIVTEGYTFYTVGRLPDVSATVAAGNPVRVYTYDDRDGEFMASTVVIHGPVRHVVTQGHIAVPAQWVD